jgi:long-chain acyl-CoA synthetase
MTFSEVINTKFPDKLLLTTETSKLYYSDVLTPVTGGNHSVIKITATNPADQLKEAFTLAGSYVPFIVPENLKDEQIELSHKNADFAVATSGTTFGKSKYYFRTIKSWADFFPEQNELFGINENTKIFVQGSMCFTGNFNMMAGVAAAGAMAVGSISLRSDRWASQIKKYNVDTIYLVPNKLLHLCKDKYVFENIKTVICGSQLISIDDYHKIHKSFPNAKIILYYGSSEVSYVSYTILNEPPTSNNCVGKVFKGVSAEIGENGHIIVNTPYHVCGVTNPIDTGDVGYIKNGLLYFSHRDIKNEHRL